MTNETITFDTLYLAFTTAYSNLLDANPDKYTPDQALLCMMKAYPSEFTLALDEHMLYLAQDPKGYNIQKRFRSLDVIKDGVGGHIDMCIWQLMCQAEIFWKLLEDIHPPQTLH